MNRVANRKLFTVFLVLIFLASALALTNCATSDEEVSPTTSTESTDTTSTAVSLSSSDFSTVGVCSGTIDVSSTAFKSIVAAANSFTFLHKTYSSDADIPFICGKEGVWDPSDAAAFGTTNAAISLTDGLPALIQQLRGSVMICNTGFDFAQVDYGFHDATTFRGEVTFTNGTTTHRARYRFVVSGTGAGATLASLGLNLADLTVTDGNDNALSTVTDILALLALNPTSITLKVKAGATTHITVTGGVICAKEE